MAKCSKSKKIEKPKKPKFECEKCGAAAEKKKQVYRPAKKRNKKGK